MPLTAHHPLQEDSGSTAYDHTGNGYDGTINGATTGATGILGASAYSFDGSDDYVQLPVSRDWSTEFTWAGYHYLDDTGSDHMLLATDDSSYTQAQLFYDTGGSSYQLAFSDGSSFYSVNGNTSPSTSTWYHIVATHDGTTGTLFVNAAEEGSLTSNAESQTNEVRAGAEGSNNKNHAGKISNIRLYDHVLTDTEIQYLYDVGTRGSVLTDTKTHGSSVQPDFRADVTLNSQSATAYITGSPGTSSEETLSASLSDGSNDYTLSWGSDHTDFRIEVVADLSDITQRVLVNRAVLLN